VQTILLPLSFLTKYIKTIVLFMTVLWRVLISALLVIAHIPYECWWMGWEEGERYLKQLKASSPDVRYFF